MSPRRIPIFSTLVVLAAVAVMVALGFWQLDRLHQKEVLLASYMEQGSHNEVLLGWAPRSSAGFYYRRAQIDCQEVVGWKAVAGKNEKGASGWAHVANCLTDIVGPIDGIQQEQLDVVVGWSNQPANPTWQGGTVLGTIAPSGNDIKLVADPPLAGLQANAKPDPNTIPNNHLAYAVQWFLFALTALVIYAIALRKRLKTS